MIVIEHRVRERAYYIWESEGRVSGRAHSHWIQAEAELAAERETMSAEVVALSAEVLHVSAAKAKPVAKTNTVAAKTVAAKAPAKKAAPSKAPAKKAARKGSAEVVALH